MKRPIFSVLGMRLCTQSASQQNLGANGFKRIATTHARGDFGQAIERFGGRIRVPVVKISHDLLIPIFHSSEQRMKGGFQFGRKAMQPCMVQIERLALILSIPDIKELFLQCVSGLKQGKVERPRFQDERLTLGQISTPTQKNVPIVHQPASFGVAQSCTQFFAHGVQTGIGKFDDVEVVHNDRSMRQQIIASLFVRLPHVHADTGNSCSDRYRQTLQILLDTLFIPVAQEINDEAAFNIGQNTARFVQQIDFINAQDGHRLVNGLLREMGGRLTKERANRPFIQANIVSDTSEGPAQSFMVNVVDQAIRHEVMFIHIFEWLKERAVTRPALIALAMNEDADTFCSNGLIHYQLLLDPVLIKQSTPAMDTTDRRSDQLRLDSKVMLLLINTESTIVRQAQEVQGHLSQIILPDEFHIRRVKPVARERRLLEISTPFPDNDSSCRRSEAEAEQVEIKDDGNSEHATSTVLVCMHCLEAWKSDQ